jgi:hypothetical protein
MQAQREPEPRLWLGTVLLLTAVFGLWMDLSPIHRHHNGDSAVQILASLDRWTPFFWEQNRFGMLVPLLALPFENPFHNLLVQVWLRSVAMILSFFLLARVVLPRLYWPAVGGAALGLFLAAKSVAHQNYLQTQPYFQAMALALGGVLLFDRGGRARIPGVLLIALAFWISPGTLFWLFPLLWLRRVLGLEPGWPDRRFWPSWEDLRARRGLSLFLLIGACFAASLIASAAYAFFAYGGTDLGAGRVADWSMAWRGLAEKAVHYLSASWVVLLGLALAVAAALTIAGRRRGALAISAGLCLLGAAAGELAILGTSGWIHRENCDIRFLTSGLIALIVAGPALILSLLLEKRPVSWHRAANFLALAALLPILFLRFGPPSVSRARAALDEGLGRHSAEILASGSTHVLGNFWRVWPTVLHANLSLFERGERRRVWGISHRSAPTRDLWQPADWKQARFAVLGADSEIERYREWYGIPRLFRKADPAPPVLVRREVRLSVPPLDFYTLRPCRILDTFQDEALVSGEPARRIEVTGACGIPAEARALAVNIKAVRPASPGHIVLFPTDRPQPRQPTLAFEEGRTAASFQILPLSDEPPGALSMAATVEDGGDVRLQLEISGYFVHPGERSAVAEFGSMIVRRCSRFLSSISTPPWSPPWQKNGRWSPSNPR